MKARLKLAELRAPLAFMLGSGLGGVCDGYESDLTVPFDQIPDVGSAGVRGHDGVLTRAYIEGRACLFVKGRRHRYEGNPSAIEALVVALREAGVRRLVLTCAAGCLSTRVGAGNLMLVDDVVDFQFHRFGTCIAANARSTARGLKLDSELSRRLEAAAATAKVAMTRGVLASLPGPTYETPAEIVALQRMGVDAVSMSVVPEFHAAASRGIRVAALAHMTNWAAGLGPGTVTHDHVLASGHAASDSVSRLIAEFVTSL